MMMMMMIQAMAIRTSAATMETRWASRADGQAWTSNTGWLDRQQLKDGRAYLSLGMDFAARGD